MSGGEIGGAKMPLANGAACAAIVAAGVGCFAMGVLSVAGDASKRMAGMLNFYSPSGPLSGVSTMAVVVWLVVWVMLARLWRGKTVALGRLNLVAFLLLTAGLLLTFPPIGDLLIGK
jgi:hypothetical protein